jgi:hypothetical protein
MRECLAGRASRMSRARPQLELNRQCGQQDVRFAFDCFFDTC